MALHLFLSNSLDTLAEKFTETFPMKGRDPFEALYAVVPNSGMGTFLKRHLARSADMGIAANVECPFLQRFLTDQMVKFFSPEEKESFRQSVSFWTPETLSWQIDHLLAKEKELLSEFSNYWEQDPVKRHLLACELARCFDRYQLYRSSCTGRSGKTLELWRSGKIDSAQAHLYRKLNELCPDPDTFYRKFFQTPSPLLPLPEKIGIFGISSMSELHLLCLKKLAEFSEISLFCPSACQVYYGDLLSRKEMLKELRNSPENAQMLLDDAASSNQLLADLGVNGREFFNLLLEHGCFTGEETEELYIDPAEENGDTLLHLFQSDILNARVRTAPPLAPGEEPPPPKDNSLRINCCPSLRRELEMLHDQLLELFYSKSRQCSDGKTYKVTPELRMEDVIVMFPDINKAAPMIDAVFSAGPFKGKYAICDRSTAAQSQVIECFSRLLELPKGRCTSEEIIGLLEFGCLSTKLHITPEELTEVTSQVFRARINWGLDSTEHLKFRNRAFEEFSWQDGIDRLLTEFARGEDASVIYAPCETGGIDGSSAGLFSIVAEFIATLKLWRAQLYNARTPEEWNEFMQHWIQTFFAGGSKEYLPELAALRSAVGKVVKGAAAADAESPIAPEVFISRLKSEYSLPGGKQHFLRDKITFCSLVPLRAIPAKVIAILGLNDGEFPRMSHANSFDLLKAVQRNDPNSANDGRFLFLEALMAAKEHLILSYVGLSDGQELAPAIPMVGVETVLEKSFHLRKNNVSVKALELESLQKNHPEKLTKPKSESLPPPPSPLPEKMSLSTLLDLLTLNCKSFYLERYGFEYSAREQDVLVSDDPEELSPLDNSALLKALWSLRLDEDIPETDWLRYVQKARFLPVNGEEIFDNAATCVKQVDDMIAGQFKDQTALECKVPLTVPLINQLHEITLYGTLRLPGDWKSSNTLCRAELLTSSSRPEKKLKFYLEQLLLAAFLPEKEISGILYPIKEQNYFFLPARSGSSPSTENAVEKLRQLVTIALGTFSAQKPLPIFANASYAWAETYLEESMKPIPEDITTEEKIAKDEEKADQKAFNAFESDLKYNEVISVFYDQENFQEGNFSSLADKIYSPIAALESRKISELPEHIVEMENSSK
jgi:exodeoxyribonuclease V gamma subunit